eukprot:2744245-Amphidinium_carterae.2
MAVVARRRAVIDGGTLLGMTTTRLRSMRLLCAKKLAVIIFICPDSSTRIAQSASHLADEDMREGRHKAQCVSSMYDFAISQRVVHVPSVPPSTASLESLHERVSNKREDAVHVQNILLES